MKRKRINIGSVTSGSMRPDDLIPDFLYELRHQTPTKREHLKLIREIDRNSEVEGYFDSEDGAMDLEALFDALDTYAPPYFYFGAHPGDGADYGFWLSEDWQESFDGLKVSDLSEVPTGYSGEVAVVTDHGNVSLYSVSRGRKSEVWSIV